MSMKETDVSNTNQQPVTEVCSGIYRIRIPLMDNLEAGLDHLNAYLIQGTRGWLLIDTGWYKPGSFKSLEDSLQSLNLGFKDIRTIILTHSHPDHYGMAGAIKQQAPKIQMLCHRWEADLIESRYIKFAEPQQDVA